ncbi:hypothetical protein FSP39_001078 [Pinctada imbricata]|uniref:G-protein coupled receptors family 1 profile domain-containing protein n=1 Tax=Pinctada imbricata TaxID=66713 RepID=A0AA88Y9P9_PINIB|nr:hypothetical protein FSP39_001078 [Pinctada imbricata]
MPIKVDQEFLDRTWTLPIVITVLFGAVGITGNLCVIMVYARYLQRVEERYFIPFLAVADGCSVIIASIFFLLLDIYRPFFTSDVLCKSLQFFSWSFNQCSTLIILSLALHRYLRICRPFGPQMTLKWKRIAMIGCFVVAIITSLPILVFTGTHEILLITNKNTSHNGSFCVFNGDNGNEDGKHYNNFLVFGNFTLFITIAVLYVLVGKQIFLRHRIAKQKNDSKSSTEDKSVRNGQVLQNETQNRSQIRSKFTTTFSLIMVSYLISYLPLFIIVISKTNNPHEFFSVPEWKADIFLIIHRSFILNNVLILVSYVLVGKEIFLRNRRAKQRTTGKSSTDEDKSVRNGQVFQNKSPNRSQIRSKFTTTFFLIIGSYLISYLPLFIIMISKTINPQEFYSASEWKADMYLIIHRSFSLNNVVNPLIYTFFDSIFKKSFKKMLQSVMTITHRDEV